ncbi:MAG: retron Eco8 family effector endonuclease [Clostridia bacterium]|nr:retron Eco8 family effector endonuclease [Clostridia bacterium]
MPIASIKIKNFKSLKNIDLDMSCINCLIGENGTGKSNILKSVAYFYQNLTTTNFDNSIIDRDNPFSDYAEISLTYDFNRILMIATKREKTDENLNVFFKNIFSFNTNYISTDGLSVVTFRQYKKGRMHYWNVPFEFRLILKNIFPIYFINSRHIDLTNWEDIWHIIGDLSKIQESQLPNNIIEAFTNAYGYKHHEILQYIKNLFKNNDIYINQFTPKQRGASIYQLQLGGNKFKFQDESLDYYSDGSNSYNYLKLLISLVNNISPKKVKEPLLVIDEPETGLHPRLIDNLANAINSIVLPSKILVSTHSSRMVKNLLSNNSNCTMHHTSIDNNYTNVEKMQGVTDYKQNIKVSEKEASFYFSSGIVFVEGVTEMELFTNGHLLSIFSFLKNIDFYSYDSDNVKLRIVHPDEKKVKIPYMLILDLDKIIKYDKASKSFSFTDDSFVNPLVNKKIELKEKYYYTDRRKKTLYLRRRIIGLKKNCKFYSDKYWGYIKSDYYSTFRGLIKEYCQEYNVFPLSTTVEGLLINKDNHSIVKEWLLTEKNPDDINAIYNFIESDDYRTTVLRLIHSGKYDNLTSIIDEGSIYNRNTLDIYRRIKNIQSSKTSGWINRFLDYFFDKYINLNGYTFREKNNIFRSYFSELSSLVDTIGKTFIKIQY